MGSEPCPLGNVASEKSLATCCGLFFDVRGADDLGRLSGDLCCLLGYPRVPKAQTFSYGGDSGRTPWRAVFGLFLAVQEYGGRWGVTPERILELRKLAKGAKRTVWGRSWGQAIDELLDEVERRGTMLRKGLDILGDGTKWVNWYAEVLPWQERVCTELEEDE